ncbi:MAG: transaldolase [Deltaproteobacteria bacterium]
MKENPLLSIQKFGQSIWLDFIARKMIKSGKLKKLIDEDGIRGVTSNPQIFKEAIAKGEEYENDIRSLARKKEIYQTLTVDDIQQTADLFRPLYDSSDGRHGFVSLEVNPHLARDIDSTLEEARRLWFAVERPNVLIKVPGTVEGLTCIQQLISEGININVTLLFGLPRYRKVAEAYIAGMEARFQQNLPLERVASVASFFLSRIDVLVDPLLEKWIEAGGDRANQARNLRGQIAIASARQAYQIYKEIFKNGRFKPLARQGARPQRVLWASTSTKNPDYSDVKYVEALIGPETINTMPQKTLDAYRDHGNPAGRLEEDLNKAAEIFHKLSELDIDIDEQTRQLEDEGIRKFIEPYDSLMTVLEEKRNQIAGTGS